MISSYPRFGKCKSRLQSTKFLLKQKVVVEVEPEEEAGVEQRGLQQQLRGQPGRGAQEEAGLHRRARAAGRARGERGEAGREGGARVRHQVREVTPSRYLFKPI